MFDYARNMQLALTDVARRTAMKVAGGVVIVLGAGFLLAALWTFLADTLGWGPLWASLAIGVLFVVIGLVVMSRGGQVKHPVPTTDDLKAEVGKKADLVLIRNEHSPVSFPLLHPYGHVVFQAQRGDVEAVVVDGRVVHDELGGDGE